MENKPDCIEGIEKFFIKNWETWDGDSSHLIFSNANSPLELASPFVDFPVYTLEINLEICKVIFIGETEEVTKDLIASVK